MTKTRKKPIRWSNVFLHTVLMAGVVIMVFPFVWMFLTSFKSFAEIYSFSFLPKHFQFDNYVALFERTDFPRWFANSGIIAVATTVSELFFDALIAYVLAKMQFPGRQLIFVLILSTMMIPTEMLVIPWYVMASHLQWTDTYWGIMFPGLISAFGVFLLRQFFLSLSDDTLDAARIDGMGEFRIFWSVALPQIKSALAALAILVFLGNWNAYLWPVIAINSSAMRTLPVGISLFSSGDNGNQWHMIMTASSMAVLPVMVVFMIFQRKIIEGIALTGLK
ncbi:MAG: carbohydrate ABC transporter permease [Desulfitobacteriaceae bacterium]